MHPMGHMSHYCRIGRVFLCLTCLIILSYLVLGGIHQESFFEISGQVSKDCMLLLLPNQQCQCTDWAASIIAVKTQKQATLLIELIK